MGGLGLQCPARPHSQRSQLPEARPRRNRIVVGVPLYGHVSPRWVQSWEEFKLAFGKYERNGGIVETAMSYVELAMNTIVRNTLADCAAKERPSQALSELMDDLQTLYKQPPNRAIAERIVRELMVRTLDYFLFIECDNVVPAEVIELVAGLDPKVHKIVGFPYTGRTEQDLRPIPGDWDSAGNWQRLTYQRFRKMVDNPGFHEVGSVGMGCTAIHRSVFEEWLPEDERGAWFRNNWRKDQFDGHDIYFCYRARQQGHQVWVNTEVKIGHIGEYTFTADTFLQTHEFNIARKADRIAQDKAEAVVHVGYVGDLERQLLPETAAGLKESGLPVEFDQLGPGTERHDLYARLWEEGKTFLSVEPDIVFRDGDLEELLDCPEPWCGFAGQCPPFGYYVGFGCTKVTGELIAKYPEAMKVTGTWQDPKHPPMHWCTVDGRVKAYLLGRGAMLHIHGPVDHRIKGKALSHGCVPPELVANPAPMIPPPYLRQLEGDARHDQPLQGSYAGGGRRAPAQDPPLGLHRAGPAGGGVRAQVREAAGFPRALGSQPE